MKFDNPYSIFLDDSPLELVFPSNNSYKGSSTKEGSKLYSLLTDITNKFDEVIRAVPRIEDFQNMSNEQVLEHYYLSVGAESLWDSRELIMKAISEQNKLIKEEYDNNNK